MKNFVIGLIVGGVTGFIVVRVLAPALNLGELETTIAAVVAAIVAGVLAALAIKASKSSNQK